MIIHDKMMNSNIAGRRDPEWRDSQGDPWPDTETQRTTCYRKCATRHYANFATFYKNYATDSRQRGAPHSLQSGQRQERNTRGYIKGSSAFFFCKKKLIFCLKMYPQLFAFIFFFWWNIIWKNISTTIFEQTFCIFLYSLQIRLLLFTCKVAYTGQVYLHNVPEKHCHV